MALHKNKHREATKMKKQRNMLHMKQEKTPGVNVKHSRETSSHPNGAHGPVEAGWEPGNQAKEDTGMTGALGPGQPIHRHPLDS